MKVVVISETEEGRLTAYIETPPNMLLEPAAVQAYSDALMESILGGEELYEPFE